MQAAIFGIGAGCLHCRNHPGSDVVGVFAREIYNVAGFDLSAAYVSALSHAGSDVQHDGGFARSCRRCERVEPAALHNALDDVFGRDEGIHEVADVLHIPSGGAAFFGGWRVEIRRFGLLVEFRVSRVDQSFDALIPNRASIANDSLGHRRRHAGPGEACGEVSDACVLFAVGSGAA